MNINEKRQKLMDDSTKLLEAVKNLIKDGMPTAPDAVIEGSDAFHVVYGALDALKLHRVTQGKGNPLEQIKQLLSAMGFDVKDFDSPDNVEEKLPEPQVKEASTDDKKKWN